MFFSYFFQKHFCSEGNQIQTQLLKNAVIVDANIHQGEAFNRSIQEAFAQAKNRLYHLHFQNMETYQNKYELI